jgi:hypothetical protein
MSIPEDITARVQRDFPQESGTVLARLLKLRRENETFSSDRLLRCVVYSAHGDASRIEPLIELGLRDYRDLIVSAECNEEWKHVRDMNQPFTE